MSMTDTQFTGTGFYAEFADKSLLRSGMTGGHSSPSCKRSMGPLA